MLLLAKNAKRNWNWRNYRLFCHIFVIGEISIGEGADPLSPSPWLRLCSKRGKQKRCSQIFCEVSGVFQRNFNCSKNSAVLEPRTGQFSRTWGFEAKAKDLTFEAKAKAKDFKMCPRGLHLCTVLTLFYTGYFVNVCCTGEGGGKNETPKPKSWKHQIWHAGWCSPKFLEKWVLSWWRYHRYVMAMFTKNNPVFRWRHS